MHSALKDVLHISYGVVLRVPSHPSLFDECLEATNWQNKHY